MKKVAALLIFLIFGSWCSAEPTESEVESRIASDGPSAQLYYQLAVAAEEQGEIVKAALNYQRALMLDPGLRVAQNQFSTFAATHGIGLRPRSWQDDVVAVVHPETLIFAGSVLGWIGAIGLGWIIFAGKQPRLRVVLAVFALLAGSILFAMGWVADPRIADANLSIISAGGEVPVLAGPASNSTLVVNLKQGSAVGVLSPRGAWTYIITPGGAKGWVESDRLIAVIPSDEGAGSMQGG